MRTTTGGPWDVKASDFRDDASPEDQLAFALRYAVLAPSGHNTQPWRFRVRGDQVEVHADRQRTLFVVDPAGRELIISCGAALFLLRIALRGLGFATEAALLPDPGQRDLLARLRLGERSEPTADELALANAITHRHTNRLPFDERAVGPDLAAALTGAAASEGAWLEPVSDPERKRAVAALIAEGNSAQLEDDAFRGEMASWVRDPDAEGGMLGHGIPLDAAGARVAGFPLRTFQTAGGAAATDQELAVGSPLLAVIGTEGDDERAWIDAGQALGHVLLLACSEGLSASFLNQPIQVARLRPLVAEAIGREGHPHVVLRLGYGPEAGPTPRRAVEDVLLR